ncbi:Pre-mRNA polyadenylation factor fip1 [Penicillium taxi]|uniref:Pre-mRNA polyadenylation factor fip1 n=1 Tax=Penicillium taxi TaxID=168475 RepID=UPI002544D727|nr:Pre-mRNA polyadenylation factor fip1 [Penicillium taxi]KAJ5894794.1 Pre-mRNA polyadenylation factor fip1 [Penicillium taxi]
MDDEEDDFYDPADSVPVTQPSYNETPVQQEEPDVDEEDEEEGEDDEDDFNIITEASADAPPPELSHPRHASLRQEAQRTPSADLSILSKSATPATPRPDAPTAAPATTAAAKSTTSQKPGSEYPAIHTSTIDVDDNPVHPSTGKPIMATDMDADFPADDKPWRRPGTDTSDYFNYGFDEFTWVSYCLKQQEVRKDVGNQKRQMDDMQSFLGMGMPPMPSAPAVPAPGPPAPMAGMSGVPDMSPDMMQGMLASMMSQGLDPSNMDPMSFMQHAQAMMGQPGGGQQGQPGFGGQGQGQVQGFGQGGQGQMGYGGGGYDQRGNYGGRGRGRRW